VYPSVRAAFRKFNEPLEGVVPWMYLDIKGLVTVGVGNLIDPVELAVKLPFRFRTEPHVAATSEQIAQEWHRIKNNPALAKAGYRACEPLTRLGLDETAVDTLFASTLTVNEAILKKTPSFEGFDSWPADAQLGLLSMAWALGPGGLARFTHFSAACRQLDFGGAAANCTINERGNPGVAPRNRADRTLFQNAAEVRRSGRDPAQLHYPAVLGEHQ
jgi:GH24 family phage-related lysozyme (muramidase)